MWQRPGEIVYVPAGWWHAVLNLDTTIAVTQNFAETRNFEQIWQTMIKDRGDLIPEWHRRLEIARPDLYERANQMGGVEAARDEMIQLEHVPDLFSSLLEWPGDISSDEEPEEPRGFS